MKPEQIQDLRIRARNIINRLIKNNLDPTEAEDLIINLCFYTSNVTIPSIPTVIVKEPIKNEVENQFMGSLKELEKKEILKHLKNNKFNRKLTAESLGINERTFYRKLKLYNITKYNYS